MTSWRLSALSSGTSAKAGPALLPVPAVDAGAKNSREQVFGGPAVLVPMPAPMPVTDRNLTAQANAGNIGLPSSYFNTGRPSIYWVNSRERAPVSRRSDNQMPVPAIDPRGVPGIVMPGALFRGQYQVVQPKVAPKFANLNAPGKKLRRA